MVPALATPRIERGTFGSSVQRAPNCAMSPKEVKVLKADVLNIIYKVDKAVSAWLFDLLFVYWRWHDANVDLTMMASGKFMCKVCHGDGKLGGGLFSAGRLCHACHGQGLHLTLSLRPCCDIVTFRVCEQPAAAVQAVQGARRRGHHARPVCHGVSCLSRRAIRHKQVEHDTASRVQCPDS